MNEASRVGTPYVGCALRPRRGTALAQARRRVAATTVTGGLTSSGVDRLLSTLALDMIGRRQRERPVVDYSQAVDAFFAPRPAGAALPEAVVSAGPARRLRDACEPIAMRAVWSPGTNAAVAAEGLDFLTSYVGGRAASMGSPVGYVVAAAFAWFEPGLVRVLYDAALATVTRQRLIDLRDEATRTSLRDVLDGADPTEIANLVADAVEPAEGMGRPLFSGLRARGRPADPVRRLWWACDLVREHRGDSHVAAAAAAGIGRRAGADKRADRALGRHAPALVHGHEGLVARGHAGRGRPALGPWPGARRSAD